MISVSPSDCVVLFVAVVYIFLFFRYFFYCIFNVVFFDVVYCLICVSSCTWNRTKQEIERERKSICLASHHFSNVQSTWIYTYSTRISYENSEKLKQMESSEKRMKIEKYTHYARLKFPHRRPNYPFRLDENKQTKKSFFFFGCCTKKKQKRKRKRLLLCVYYYCECTRACDNCAHAYLSSKFPCIQAHTYTSMAMTNDEHFKWLVTNVSLTAYANFLLPLSLCFITCTEYVYRAYGFQSVMAGDIKCKIYLNTYRLLLSRSCGGKKFFLLSCVPLFCCLNFAGVKQVFHVCLFPIINIFFHYTYDIWFFFW